MFHVVAASKPLRGKASTGILKLDPSGKCLLSIFDIFSWRVATSANQLCRGGMKVTLRLCNLNSNSVYIVVAVGCHACATRTNQEVYLQTVYASRKNLSSREALAKLNRIRGKQINVVN